MRHEATPVQRAIAEARAALDRLLDAEIARWSAATASERLPATPPSATDPRQRLDSLARRLDGRLRQGLVPNPTRPPVRSAPEDPGQNPADAP